MVVIALLASCDTGQVPDKSYKPTVSDPAYRFGEGPLVCLDEAHNNFHTLENRFWAFGELLRRDGYMVQASREKFSAAALEHCRILVIANAQLEGLDWGEYPYPTPSGFTDEEIEYYLKHYKPYDKAGAYGVQDWLGYTGIEKIEGSFYNVMGLPVKLLYEELIKF